MMRNESIQSYPKTTNFWSYELPIIWKMISAVPVCSNNLGLTVFKIFIGEVYPLSHCSITKFPILYPLIYEQFWNILIPYFFHEWQSVLTKMVIIKNKWTYSCLYNEGLQQIFLCRCKNIVIWIPLFSMVAQKSRQAKCLSVNLKLFSYLSI